MTGAVVWPSASDYTAAVQDAERCLIHPSLDGAEVEVNRFGLPVVKAGQTAAVFKLKTAEGPAALRLFTAPTSLASRYAALERHLIARPCELFVGAKWLDGALALGHHRYPAVLMPWVQGTTLANYLDDAVDEGDTERIRSLADSWDTCMNQLASSGIAHGDLQHGNVLLDNGQIRLIDYDGAWVEGMQTDASELGQPNYQHPARIEGEMLGQTTDTFSALVILTSIHVLARDPELWRKYYSGENLIFTQRDFVALDAVSRPIWADVAELDGRAGELIELLRRCCRVDAKALGSYSDLLVGGATSLDEAPPFVANRAGRSSGVPWWTEDGEVSDAALEGESTWSFEPSGNPQPTNQVLPGATDVTVEMALGGAQAVASSPAPEPALGARRGSEQRLTILISALGLIIGLTALILLLAR